jgi:hypothetical protein
MTVAQQAHPQSPTSIFLCFVVLSPCLASQLAADDPSPTSRRPGMQQPLARGCSLLVRDIEALHHIW